jgi:hypothetical protein
MATIKVQSRDLLEVPLSALPFFGWQPIELILHFPGL